MFLTVQFAKVDEDTMAALAADPSGLLTQVLLYHVVPGIVLAEDLMGGDTATTTQGSTVTVTVDGESLGINGAGLETTNILASNGVIHVIDSVLIPPPSGSSAPDQGSGQSIVEIASGNDMFTTLVAALGAASLVEALQGDGPFTVFAPTNAGELPRMFSGMNFPFACVYLQLSFCLCYISSFQLLTALMFRVSLKISGAHISKQSYCTMLYLARFCQLTWV